jgi:MFS family permease
MRLPTINETSRKWWILAATGGSLGVVLFDGAIFVALPTVRDELGLSGVDTQWVVNAYVLTLTVLVAAAGRIGDIVGHRAVFVSGSAVLAIGSVWVGVAGAGGELLVARAIQGAGTAGLLAAGIAMTGIAFAERERGMALGVYGLIGSAAAAVAPFAGGLATDAASWRLIPLANVVLILALVALVLVAWREPERDPARTALDGLGLLTLLGFLVPLVVALMQAPAWGWGSTSVFCLLLLSALGLLSFARV